MDKQRYKKVIKLIAALIFTGTVYWGVITKTGFGIPCMFYTITKLKCPGCGITHAIVHILEGKIYLAFSDNIVVVAMFPIILFDLIVEAYRYIYHKDTPKWFSIFLVIQIIILGVWFIVRNILGI